MEAGGFLVQRIHQQHTQAKLLPQPETTRYGMRDNIVPVPLTTLADRDSQCGLPARNSWVDVCDRVPADRPAVVGPRTD